MYLSCFVLDSRVAPILVFNLTDIIQNLQLSYSKVRQLTLP